MSVEAAQPKENYANFGMLLVVLGVLLFARLVSLWFNNSELYFDEAQYWAWAQSLEWGYFSKPPMLAWLIAASTQLCGDSSEFCVRLPAPSLHVGTSVILYFLGKHMFTKAVGFWSAITYTSLPAVSLSSTIISTDVALLFFWALALLAFQKLISEQGGILWAVILGLAIGLGMLSKYAMAYFFLCAAIYGFAARPEVRFWKLSRFWIALLIGLIVFSGNIFWNLSNDLTTVNHTGDNIGWQGIRYNINGLLEFFGAQFGVFGPITFGVFLAALWQWRFFGGNEKQRFLVAFSIPVLVVILVQAFVSKAYANWAAVTYVAATVLVAQLFVQEIPRKWLKTSVAIHVILFTILAVAVTRAGPGQLARFGGIEPFERTQGARELSELVSHELQNGEYCAVVTGERRTSSLLTYGLRAENVPVLAWRRGEAPNDYFEQRSAFQDNPAEPVLIVIRKKGIANLADVFKSVELAGKSEISSGELGDITLYRASGLKPGFVN